MLFIPLPSAHNCPFIPDANLKKQTLLLSVLTCSWGFLCADVLPAPILPHFSASCRFHWVQALHCPMHLTHFCLGIGHQ